VPNSKDRLNVGKFWNATGADFYQPVYIGQFKRPPCFGWQWQMEHLEAQYFSSQTTCMTAQVLHEVSRTFDAYYCEKCNGGTNPVILLVDNSAAHSVPTDAKRWTSDSGTLSGYRLSNVLVIFTSGIHPLEAGCIQIAKANYRRRQVSWALGQLKSTRPEQKAVVTPSVSQAKEWFTAGVKDIPA
jgi:hypothetical protein